MVISLNRKDFIVNIGNNRKEKIDKKLCRMHIKIPEHSLSRRKEKCRLFGDIEE